MRDARLKRLTIGEVARYGPTIRFCLADAFGDSGTPGVVANMYAEIVEGKIDAWAGIANQDGKKKFLGLLTTRVAWDTRFERGVLVIETINMHGRIPGDAWKRAMDDILDYARARDCTVIEADVMNEKIARLSKRLGFREISRKILREV